MRRRRAAMNSGFMGLVVMGLGLGLWPSTTGIALGQALPAAALTRSDAVVTYQWVHTNTQPGECGCFSLNGGAGAATWNLDPGLSAVAEGGVQFGSHGAGPGNSLTLISLLGGARYHVPYVWIDQGYRIQPFAQVLAGIAHAGGGVAGAGESTFAFETRAGGGLDLTMTSRFILRVIQVDYDRTAFRNGVNNRQNNLLLGGGLIFRWLR
jgi:outer membrane immunogenic protein